MIVLVHVTAYWLLVLLAGLVIVDAIPFDWARICLLYTSRCV